MLEVNLLNSFVSVYEQRSVKKAAALVFRSQSAISMQIQKLELIVEKKLFTRHKHGVEPTAAAVELYKYAKLILDTQQNALDVLQGRERKGTVTLGCPDPYLNSWIPDLLKKFNLLYPQILIKIENAPSFDLLSMIEKQAVDLALISSAYSKSKNTIYEESFVWVSNDKYFDLKNSSPLKIVTHSLNSIEYTYINNALSEIRGPYELIQASNNFNGTIAIARAGLAISIIPKCSVPDDLYIIEDTLPKLPSYTVSIDYPLEKPMSNAILLGNFIRESMSNN